MAPEDPTTEAATTPNPVGSDETVPDAPDAAAAPARKRAPRRATKKASAPRDTTTRAATTRSSRTTKAAAAKSAADAASADPAGVTDTDSALRSNLPEAGAEPQTSSQGELAFADPVASLDESSASAATSAASAPVKKATRKRVTRKQVAPEPAPAPESLLAGLDGDEDDATTAATTDAAVSAGASSAPDSATAGASGDDAGSAGLSVLFQAPAPAASGRPATTRRRRAAAPAGAPGTHETTATGSSRSGSERDANLSREVSGQRSETTVSTPDTDGAQTGEAGLEAPEVDATEVDAGEAPARRGRTGKAEKATRTVKGAKAAKTAKGAGPEKDGKAEKDGRGRSGKAGKGRKAPPVDEVDEVDAAGATDTVALERGDDSGSVREQRDPEAGRDTTDTTNSADDARGLDGDDESGVEHEAATERGASTDASGDERDDDESTPRRSRRRRGGKGRRGRGSNSGHDGSISHGSNGSDGSNAGPDGDDAATDSGTPSEPDDQSRSERSNGPDATSDGESNDEESASSRRRRRRRRPGGSGEDSDDVAGGGAGRTRTPRARSEEPTAVRGSTRLEAKKQRRREGRENGRRRTVITEAEFLARREAVDRVMVVRNKDGRTQMGVLEDGVLVEHYIDQATNVSMAGNIYLGRVQNVLPSMEAAFVDIGKGRNAVLYAGEVNWDAAGLEGNQPKRIEHALGSGQTVLVQVTKDPIGHKGARLTSQISLPGRYLVYVPNSSMTGISRKLPDTERARLKKILRDVVPDSAGVIVRTAAEGASEAELRADVERLTATWEQIQAKAEASSSGKAGKSKGRKAGGGAGSSPTGTAPLLLHGEPDLTVRVIRDVFNEDFTSLVVSGEQAWDEIHPYISAVAPDLESRVSKWTGTDDLFTHHRVDEQLAKAMDRKVWLPSGGSLVIDRTEAMTVVDVNTGKFVGSGGNLEETVTKNNIEAAEEIVRQLRLRDIGGIIVVDFIDMVLEANRDLVVRRLLECLGRDRTKHQVAEVTSLGLVQMTRKRVGSGLIEVFGETCEACNGRGFIIHSAPIDRGVGAGGGDSSPSTSATSAGTGAGSGSGSGSGSAGGRTRRGRASSPAGSGNASGSGNGSSTPNASAQPEPTRANGPTAAMIAAAAHAAALKTAAGHPVAEVAQAATSIADDVAAQLTAGSSPLSIDEQVQTQLEGVAEVAEVAELSDLSQAFGSPQHQPGEASETSPVTQSPSEPENQLEKEPELHAETQPEPSSPAPRARRRRGRVMAPAGPPRESGSSDE